VHFFAEEAAVFDSFVHDRIVFLELIHELVPHLVVECLRFGLIRVVVALQLQVPVQAVRQLLIAHRHIQQVVFQRRLTSEVLVLNFIVPQGLHELERDKIESLHFDLLEALDSHVSDFFESLDVVVFGLLDNAHRLILRVE